jgi:hypothetical protein
VFAVEPISAPPMRVQKKKVDSVAGPGGERERASVISRPCALPINGNPPIVHGSE